MSSEAVVEIIFCAIRYLALGYLSTIQASIWSCQAVHLILSMKTIFHVSVKMVKCEKQIPNTTLVSDWQSLLTNKIQNLRLWLFLRLRFIVKIGHLPSILFVIIIMRVCRMMRWCNAFCVRSRSAIIKVHLKWNSYYYLHTDLCVMVSLLQYSIAQMAIIHYLWAILIRSST